MALFQRFQRNDQLVQVTRDIPVATNTDDSLVRLIVGLGNPGKQYDDTRHNIGFAAIDAYRDANELPKWQDKPKFKAMISEDIIGGKKIILAKPTTFMNDSGQAVRALRDYYKISNDDITVIHDELDLPFGTVKQKQGGGSAGNNGLKSIIAHIGQDFNRIRIGVKNDVLDRMGASDFVLAKFNTDEQKKLREIVSRSLDMLNL